MKKFVLLLSTILLSSSVIFAAHAQAQPQCNERSNVLELLAKKYQETTIAAGVTTTGGLVEVLSDSKTGTWTIIVTTPQGMSCLVAAGDGWRTMESKGIDTDPEA